MAAGGCVLCCPASSTQSTTDLVPAVGSGIPYNPPIQSTFADNAPVCHRGCSMRAPESLSLTESSPPSCLNSRSRIRSKQRSEATVVGCNCRLNYTKFESGPFRDFKLHSHNQGARSCNQSKLCSTAETQLLPHHRSRAHEMLARLTPHCRIPSPTESIRCPFETHVEATSRGLLTVAWV